MGLTIKTERRDNVLVISLSGRLEYSSSQEFDKDFADLAEDLTGIRIYMSELKYISSMGIRSIMHLKKVSDKGGISLEIVSPSETVKDVFSLTGLDDVINIVTSETEEKDAPVIYPLRPVQRWMVDTHFMKARSTMMNTGGFLKLDPAVDMKLLAKAVNSVVENHDIFRCRFVMNTGTGELGQRFDGEIKPVTAETMSAGEFEEIKSHLRVPYEIVGHQLWNIRIIETPEEKYLLIDFYHCITDGTAIVMVFWREVNRYYTTFLKETNVGDASVHIRRCSSYADYITREMLTPPEHIEEGHRYWREMYSGFDEKKYLPPMDRNDEDTCRLEELEVPIDVIEGDFFSGKGFTENTFFIGVTLLTMAKLTGRSDVIISWVHNGRTTKTELGLMGIMLDQLPLKWEFRKGQHPEDFLKELGDKIKESMGYRKSLDIVYDMGMQGCACFILQKGVIGRRGRLKLGDTWAEVVELPEDENSGAENTLDIELNAHDDGTFSLVLDYNSGCYSESAMRDFAKSYSDMTAALQKENCDLYTLLEL